MSPPFFTIITATRNAIATLPRLLESLASQACRDFELIIQDGASTDETAAVAESWRERLPVLSLVSEPDTGIYDAWNKALPRIRGQWVLFLGADDFLNNPAALANAMERLTAVSPGIDYVSTPVIVVNADGLALRTKYPLPHPRQNFYKRMPLPHSGLFHRAALFTSQRFDDAYRIAGDYDFLCRTLTDDNYVLLEAPCVCMAMDGISSHPDSVAVNCKESLYALRRYFPEQSARTLQLRLFLIRIYQLLAPCLGRNLSVRLLEWYRQRSHRPC